MKINLLNWVLDTKDIIMISTVRHKPVDSCAGSVYFEIKLINNVAYSIGLKYSPVYSDKDGVVDIEVADKALHNMYNEFLELWAIDKQTPRNDIPKIYLERGSNLSFFTEIKKTT